MPTGDARSFEALEDVTRQRDVAAQRLLVEIAEDLFSAGRGLLTERQRTLMMGLLRGLLHDIEIPIRRTLALGLRDAGAAPGELLAELADEAVELSYPRLAQHDVLREPGLIETLRHRMLAHELAVAIWRQPRDQRAARPGRDGGDWLAWLLDGPDPTTAGLVRAYLVEESHRLDPYQHPRLRPLELPGGLARQLGWWAAAVLRGHVLTRSALDRAAVDDILEAAVTGGAGRAGDLPDAATRAPMRLAQRLLAQGVSGAHVPMCALSCGAVSLFEAALAQLTALAPGLVRRLTWAPGGEALAVLCRAVEIEPESFAAILRWRARASGELDCGAPALAVETLLAFYEQLEANAVTRLLRLWRRPPDFLEAIRRIGG